MIPYLSVFAVSIVFLKLSSIVDNKYLRKIIILIALFVPCVLAGVRSDIIGTDIKWYTKPLFEAAKSSNSFSDFKLHYWWNPNIWRYMKVSEFEIGFTVLTYFVTKVTNSFSVLLFSIEALIIFPIFLGIIQYKQFEKKEWLPMLIFYLLFYNVTLNWMRQFLGVAFFFYGFSILQNKKHGMISFLLFFTIGVLFHKSTLIGLFVFLIYIVITHNYKSKRVIKINDNRINVNKIILLVVVIISLFITLNLDVVKDFLFKFGFGYYNYYLKGDLEISFIKIIKVLPIIMIFILVRKDIKKDERTIFFELLYVIDAFFISQLSSITTQSARIGLILQIFNVISFSIMIDCIDRKRKKFLLFIMLITYLIALWYYTIVYKGSHQTIPFIPFWYGK